MAISAKDVKKLRDTTGAGMMDCKKALVETDGDFDKAVEYLQIKGLGKAEKKSGRVAAEGIIASAITADKKGAVLVEVNSETDFVARNEDFQKFVSDLAQHAIAQNIQDLDSLLASTIGGKTVEEIQKAQIATIGENINIRRIVRAEVQGNGFVAEYTHNGNIGVLVAFESDADAAKNDAVEQLGRDVAMHIAAMNPQFGSIADISDETVEAHMHIEREKALESGKPAEIVEKMIVGRINKWKQEICLLSQPFVKNGDLTIEQEIARVAKETGTNIKFQRFVRLVRGEGIEKEAAMSYADEVAAALKG